MVIPELVYGPGAAVFASDYAGQQSHNLNEIIPGFIQRKFPSMSELLGKYMRNVIPLTYCKEQNNPLNC